MKHVQNKPQLYPNEGSAETELCAFIEPYMKLIWNCIYSLIMKIVGRPLNSNWVVEHWWNTITTIVYKCLKYFLRKNNSKNWFLPVLNCTFGNFCVYDTWKTSVNLNWFLDITLLWRWNAAMWSTESLRCDFCRINYVNYFLLLFCNTFRSITFFPTSSEM